MTAFDAIFATTSEFLRSRGLEVTEDPNAPCSTGAVEAFTNSTKLRLPSQLAEFYTEVSNGFYFSWEHSEDLFAVFELPKLDDFTQKSIEFTRNACDFANDPKSLDRCVELVHRPRAFEIWQDMKSWIPFWREPNGDSFCIRSSNGQIVFDQHDWFDGFGDVTTIAGLDAGASLLEFIDSCSRFCFQPPRDYCWGLFANHGKITWDPSYFDSTFTRT